MATPQNTSGLEQNLLPPASMSNNTNAPPNPSNRRFLRTSKLPTVQEVGEFYHIELNYYIIFLFICFKNLLCSYFDVLVFDCITVEIVCQNLNHYVQIRFWQIF
jgi:hypothetical protein